MNITVEFIISAADKNQYPAHNLNEYVLSGRSNVGKSSFINTILNRKNVAYTSSQPGKTQTLNFFKINEAFYFVDVPGYGYAKVSKKDREKFGIMIEEYLTTRSNLKSVFLLIDARHKPTEDDILMYDYLKHFNIPVTIIATKIDKIPKTHVNKHIKIIKQTLELEKGDKLISFSSVTKQGFNEVWDLINKMEN